MTDHSHRRRLVVAGIAICFIAGCNDDGSQASTTTVAATTSTAAEATTTSVATTPGITAPATSEYETDSGTVSLECEGTGQVAVVLIAGGNDPPSVWNDVVDGLGENVLTCRFDANSATDELFTPGRRSEALSAALTASGIPGPYVLVAHSLGGLTARRFGDAHPDQLAGAVLLDPTTPSALLDARADLEEAGWDATATQADADAAVTWPAVPLRVLSHDPSLITLGSEATELLWTEGQQDYADLSPVGEYEAVTGSGHFIYVDALDTVVAAIEAVVAEATAP